MIHVYGTSHVSEESLELIDEKLAEHDPDIVALELDPMRLDAMLSDEPNWGGPLFIRLLRKFQQYIGSRTGVMPGEEMLYAYEKSMNEGREVALIDRDIRITIDRMGHIRRKEKVRAVFDTLIGLFFGEKFDISRIPGDEMISELIGELEQRYPGLYRVFVEERDLTMARHLRNLQEDEPDAEIVAFVGAAHREGVKKLLAEEVQDSV